MTPADALGLLLIVTFIVAYKLRDPSEDEVKEQLFVNSITGGPLE